MKNQQDALAHLLTQLEYRGLRTPKIEAYYTEKATFKALAKGELLIRPGETVFKAYFVHQGILRVYHETKDGGHINRTFIQEGQGYAENTAYWLKKPIPVYVQALEYCELLVVDLKEFDDLCKVDVEFAMLLIEGLKEFQIRHETREFLLQTLTIKEYYSYILTQYPQLESRIPQYHVASYLGISEVSLSRIKKQIKAEKG